MKRKTGRLLVVALIGAVAALGSPAWAVSSDYEVCVAQLPNISCSTSFTRLNSCCKRLFDARGPGLVSFQEFVACQGDAGRYAVACLPPVQQGQ